MDVPARMEVEQRDASEEYSGRATYGGFRRFKVTSSEELQ